MFAAWYFCCCMKSGSAKTQIFLSILEVLENPESSPELLFINHEELQRMEVWMRIYALPQVLAAQRREDDSGCLRTALRTYLIDLVELLPEEIVASFERLVEKVESRVDSRQMLRVLQDCAEHVHKLPARELSLLPYHDLKQFLPETFLLAVIADYLCHDSDFLVQLSNILKGDPSPLRAVMETTLNYRAGRLAFLLAAPVAHMALAEYSRDDVHALLWNSAECAAPYEPDILQVVASILYSESFTETEYEKQIELVREIIQETRTFAKLRGLNKIGRVEADRAREAMRRIGLEPHQSVMNALSVVYWQVTLWALVARLDAAVAAEELAPYWLPLEKLLPHLNVDSPYDKDVAAAWSGQLNTLLKLRADQQGVLLHVRSEKPQLSIPVCAGPSFFGPWIYFDRSTIKTWNAGPRYPHAENAAVLIRLCVSVFVAIRLLQRLPEQNTHRTVFARFLIHAHDVLSTVSSTRHRAPQGEPRADEIQLQASLVGLALAGLDQVKLVGEGRLWSIHPELFCDALEGNDGIGLFFGREIAPAVLIDWITDSYNGAMNERSGPWRWLPLIEKVYLEYQRGLHHRFHDKLQAALVVRFLCQNPFNLLDLEKFNWQIAKQQGRPLQWKVPPRQMLLTVNLPADAWFPEWDDTETDVSRQLVRAIERLAALKNPGSISPEQTQFCRREWIDLLNGVNEPRFLDRFVRLRLLELLQDTELEHWYDGQETIALTLLEFGSVFELQQLLNIVYPIDADGRLAPASHARWEVRKSLLQAIYRDTMFELGEHQRRVNVQPPRQTQIERGRAHLLDNTLIRVAFSDQLSGDGGQARALSNGLREISKVMWRNHASVLTRSLEADVAQTEGGKSIQIPADSRLHPDHWNVCGSVYDPNNASIRLYLRDWDTEGLTNFFAMDARSIDQYLGNAQDETINALGIVFSKQTQGPGRYRYTFNVALTHFPEIVLALELNVGDRVCLPIRRGEAGMRRWQVSTGARDRICRVLSRHQPGEVKEIRVREYWSTRDRKRRLELRTELDFRNSLKEKEYALGLWDADISRALRQFSPPNDRKVYARLDEQGMWRPVDGTLLNLVLNVFDRSEVAILTLIGPIEGLRGEQGWRFAVLPGENYILLRRDFSSEAFEVLANEIAALKEPAGLIVCLRANWVDNVLLLELESAREKCPPLEEHYPKLDLPFDRRHIAWRQYFEQPEHCIAHRDKAGNNWFVPVVCDRVPGYPERISIRWTETPRTQEHEIEFRIFDWDERLGKVYGQPLSVREAVVSDKNWSAFVQRWLNIKKDDIIRLSRLAGIRTDGFVDVYTNENVRVRVEAESLTMLPFGPQDQIINQLRDAVIFDAKWRDVDTVPKLSPTQIPPQAIRNNSCQGIFTLVPRKTEDYKNTPTRCSVAWDGVNGLPSALHIDNLSDVFVQIGSRITGKCVAGTWTFRIASLSTSARALWRVAFWAGGQRDPQWNLRFLANLMYEGSRSAVAEESPGELVRLAAPRDDVQHLATGDGQDFDAGGVRSHVITRDVIQSNTRWIEERIEYRRARLKLPDGKMLTGICRSSVPGQELVLDEINLRMYPVGNQVSLIREFKLSSYHQNSREPKRQDASAKWEARFLDYFAALEPEIVDAVFHGKTVQLLDHELRVPADDSHIQWNSRVQLVQDELPHVLGAAYPSDGLVRLVKDNSHRVFASFRSVPPCQPNDFKQRVGGVFDDVLSLHDNPLYYVGPEEPPAGSGEGCQIYHRFEWGYGKTLLASEKNLQFNGGDFRNAKLTLFHGDCIVGVTFRRPKDSYTERAAGDGVEEEQCLIDISDVALQFSEGTTLYFQRSKYQYVHVLHLLISTEQVRVRYVEGFDIKHLSKSRSFERVDASLNSAAQTCLLKRFRSRLPSVESEPIHYTILGRMDDGLFRSTDGRKVVFEHVRFSFQSSEGSSPLQDNELVFAQAGEIRRLRNDMGLQVVPLTNLSEEEVGSDLRESVLMLRRNFSVRDELLERFFNEQGPGALGEKTLLLVRFSLQSGRISTSLMHNIPNRLASVLAGEIEGRQLLLAAVLNVTTNTVRLELRPGVFVELLQSQLDACPARLKRGAIVRIENSPNQRFRLALAAFDDERYIPDDLRPVVVLPMNNMLKERLWNEHPVDNNKFWDLNSCFTAGGLPGIVATLGQHVPADRRLGAARWEEGIRLMERAHPKIGLLGRDATKKFRIAPTGDDLAAGRLHVGTDGMEVTYVPLGGEPGDPKCFPLRWQFLTFRDDSIQDIVTRANDSRWRYHDRYTGHWQNNMITTEKIGDHTIWTGPLFLEENNNRRGGRLRYSPKFFARFGFPVDGLFSMLRGQQPVAFAVAGPSDQGGLWIELAPGRLVELPAQLVIWRQEMGEKSLAALRWDAFAPGDQVTLSAARSNDIFAISRVILHNWQPGPRSAFGQNGCFLPVQGFDEKKGALRLGAGQYRLTLPMTMCAVSGPLALLDQNNRVGDAANGIPRKGVVVLLEVDGTGKVSVVGMPHLKPVPDRDPNLWASDPLQEDIVTRGERNDLVANYGRLRRLIQAAGGVVPVTVENVYDERLLIFSRRFQQRNSILVPGELGLARVVGMLNESTALLRSGGGLLKMRINQIVSGLPERFFNRAINLLVQMDILLVLRGMPDGQAAVGFSCALKSQITVEPLEVIAVDNDADANVGLICRDTETQALYWLPKALLAWVNLSPEQIQQLFIKQPRQRELKVVVMNREKGMPHISVIDVAEVRNEFSSLVIGKELTVNLIAPGSVPGNNVGVQRYFVESASAKVILVCETYDGEVLEGSIPVEVIRRVSGEHRVVSVVPLGKKRYTLDLPLWMMTKLPAPGAPNEALQRYLRRISNNVSANSPVTNPRELNDESLESLLIDAYTSLDANPLAAWQAGVAEEWYRRDRDRMETNVAYTLIAILVLNEHGKRGNQQFSSEWRNMARNLVLTLGSRALRSCHVEILRQEWLGHATNGNRNDGLWGRLRQIENCLQTPMTAQNLRVIERFCRVVEVRRANETIQRIAHALRMAIGQPPSAADFFTRRQNEVIEPLLENYRLIPPLHNNIVSPLWPSEEGALKKLLEFINAHGLESVLLEPLPRIRRA